MNYAIIEVLNIDGSDNLKHFKRWIILPLALLFLLIVVPDIFEFDFDHYFISDDEFAHISKEFDGENPEVLPKLTLMPIDVTKVIDGDTISANLFGEEITIRYLMIDTPELKGAHQSDSQPYARKALERNDELLSKADQVYLELDVGPETDKYDRILAYIYADDLLVQEQLIEEGLGTVRYVYPPNNSYESLLRKAEEKAKNHSRNLWK